jgi:hypothetical protein
VCSSAGTLVALKQRMHALVKHALALSLCLACSSASADDKKTDPAVKIDSVTASAAGAGGATDAAAPLPLTEEELRRLLDALEQEIGRQ